MGRLLLSESRVRNVFLMFLSLFILDTAQVDVVFYVDLRPHLVFSYFSNGKLVAVRVMLVDV
jgi:hypothetical protein